MIVGEVLLEDITEPSIVTIKSFVDVLKNGIEKSSDGSLPPPVILIVGASV